MTDENELKAEIERLKFRNEKLHNHTDRMTDENYELRRGIKTLQKKLDEVIEDNKKLSLQINDYTYQLRKSGL
jgi:predicted RNase H-like nuclease (RuvC/YqgF family)